MWSPQEDTAQVVQTGFNSALLPRHPIPCLKRKKNLGLKYTKKPEVFNELGCGGQLE
jgi:hypothetical protein